ncbi:MAG: 2,3-diaminopropionate biosynthesis protein SbnB [Sneathiella sp.]|nr:2,3-diaminopropionate biosynthesis protein SbnB [Sneathiella sp.]
MNNFKFVSGEAIKAILANRHSKNIKDVEKAYLAHLDGQTVNPDSYFLRFPDNSNNRIIALPASVKADVQVSGIKWIASFPSNTKAGLKRASAVLILNDQQTGYPFACLEGSLISAARTAASAVLGAFWLKNKSRIARSIAFVGAGIIARSILETFSADDWEFNKVSVHDLDTTTAMSFASAAADCFPEAKSVKITQSIDDALSAEIVVFATNASSPYVEKPLAFRPGQIVLNISLRDIAPELILESNNLFDDVEHCLKANTSPHLAEILVTDRRFVTGTLAELIRGHIEIDQTKPTVYSPFGMGILDLTLGKSVFDEACARGVAIPVPNFFPEVV